MSQGTTQARERRESPSRYRRGAAKRSAILAAATGVFLDAGYGGATMDAVARAAGASKATVYSHFGSKEALFEAIIRELCTALTEPLRVALERSADPRETLRAFAREYVGLVLRPTSLALHRLVVAEAPRQPELGALAFAAGGEAVVGRLRDYLAALTRDGRLAACEPARVAEQFVGSITGYLQIRGLLGVAQPPGCGVDAWIDDAVDALLRAYAA